MLSFRSDRYVAFGRDAAANFRYDDSLWLSWVGATVGAGFLFGLATWLPFVMVRYLPSRFLLAALALLPLAHFWILIQGHAGSSVGPGRKMDADPGRDKQRERRSRGVASTRSNIAA